MRLLKDERMSRSSTTDFFDRRAAEWERLCYPPEVVSRLEAFFPEFGVKEGESILDVGTGTGILIPLLRRATGTNGRVCAIDLSEPMVREAYKKRAHICDVLLVADVHNLPFKSKVFDRVICFAAFPHFCDPGGALREMARVLKCDGVVKGELVIAHLLSREELAEHHARHPEVMSHRLPDDITMEKLFGAAGLRLTKIIDRPGRYLAHGVVNW
ncbi:class I SAM-dependent methyltransferase [Thermodesulforhabdus norvegica]|uniref:Methyltransferase domain-containing protein n=1 Tax=Thermodesulforhabdus norvegica TaxID=39841 RepID=A0A1I4UYF5_9BACT|nr:class I SAM-dependent methyltransferase [Thermodesulforhabdus norvegica]SFM93905.1 Methyltransferase domain-containing protein [Thermodesulforhabdus norvegica]